MDKIVIDIIIVNYKNYQDTIKCLESILYNNYNNYRVFIVDNNSENESISKIEEYITKKKLNYLKIRDKQISNVDNTNAKYFLIESEKNLGFGGGNNLGIKLSIILNVSDYIWILNNDTIIEKDAIIEQIQKMKKKNYLICGSKILNYKTNEIESCAGAIFNKWLMTSKHIKDTNANEDKIEANIDYIYGASMFFKKDFFIKYGFFDEEYFLYFEEIDLIKRVKDKKIFLAYAKKSIIYHKSGASIGTAKSLENKSEIAEYHSFRSRIIFTKKYYTYKLPIIYGLGLVYIIHRLIYGKSNLAKQILKALINEKF